MLFAMTVKRAVQHAQATRDYAAAARLLRSTGVTLEEALFVLLGCHQRPRHRKPRG